MTDVPPPPAQAAGNTPLPLPTPDVPPPATPASPAATVTVAEPGYTTTEFWVTVFTNIIGVLVAFHIIAFTNTQTQAVMGLSTMFATNIAYAISRGVRKIGTTS